MELDFDVKTLKQIQAGVHPEWRRIGDPSAYGGVFKSDKHPGKVVKVQTGDYRIFDNEISRQFQAQLGNVGDYETPNLGQAGFIPNDPGAKKMPNSAGILKYNPDQVGISFITMDEADFAQQYQGGRNTTRHAKAKGLASLYNNAGVSHTDDHPGNIKYNPKSGKAVILDYGLAGPGDGNHGRGKIVERIQQRLRSSNNIDMLDLFNEQYGDLMSDHLTEPTPQSKAALDDIIRQGEEVAEMTDPRIEPVNWSERARDNFKGVEIEQPLTVKASGAKQFDLKPETGGLTSLIARVQGLADQLTSRSNATPPKLKGYGPGGAFLSLGAADLIPSRETVKTAAKEGPVAAAKQHGGEMIRSLPVAGGVAALSTAVPQLATAAPYIAPGLIAVAGAEAIDETVKQTTGEGVLSKVRQTIGTEERTGYSAPNNSLKEQIKRDIDRVNNPPTITPTKKNPRYGSLKNSPAPELGRRLRLAGERFNPSKLEFGISEILFGR